MQLTTTKSMKYWAEEDQPREKLMRLGRHNLSDSELIAILLKSGTPEASALAIAQKILKAHGGNLNQLGIAQIEDLTNFHGIGPTKAITLLAAMELGRRRQLNKAIRFPVVNSSRSCYDLLGPQLADLPHEEFWILFLNRANLAVGKECISQGGVSGTLVDAKVVFRRALARSASALVLMHNHPSGNLEPSHMDLRLTSRLVQAGKLLEIQIWDHLIIAGNGYTSLADRGMMPR